MRSVCADPLSVTWTVAGSNDHGTEVYHLLTAATPRLIAAELARGESLGWVFISIAALDADRTEVRRWPVRWAPSTFGEPAGWAVEVPVGGHCWAEKSVSGWRGIVSELISDLFPGWFMDALGNLVSPAEVAAAR